MRTAMDIDDELLAKAAEYSGIKERSTIVRVAPEGFVQERTERRLAKFKGSMPDFGKVAVPRRRFPIE